jgi:hypothetical protein
MLWLHVSAYSMPSSGHSGVLRYNCCAYAFRCVILAAGDVCGILTLAYEGVRLLIRHCLLKNMFAQYCISFDFMFLNL